VPVHASDEEAAAFYAGFGVRKFPEGSRTFLLPMRTIAAAIAGSAGLGQAPG